VIGSGDRRQLIAAFALVAGGECFVPCCGEGGAGAPVAAVWLPARGRPPQAAARRAGLEDVEKVLTSIYAANKTALGAVKCARGKVAP